MVYFLGEPFFQKWDYVFPNKQTEYILATIYAIYLVPLVLRKVFSFNLIKNDHPLESVTKESSSIP